MTSQLDPTTAVDVLRQLHDQLGPVDPDARAIVGLQATGPGAVTLVDVTMQENGILEAPDGSDGLVVVTSEDVAAEDEAEVVTLQQLVCVLRGGAEVGVYRVADGDDVAAWSTADPDDLDAQALRPRDAAANTARRAFGLPSLVDVPPVTDLYARTWLLAVTGEAVERFDAADGPREVDPAELAEVAGRPPLGDGLDPTTATWDDVHRHAREGTLELGPFTVDPAHADWLDAAGLAQVLDRTLPSTEQLLATLHVVGDDDLLAWAIGWLTERAWYQPG
ncbi:hypothetical protein [Egicoccus sp. AB-alg6-2]|uniref:hypothetical protein n=1 Tax=Egicoccus sp. AB-alg6-2 TaxID=3242692 RepID=UPI00359CE8C3